MPSCRDLVILVYVTDNRQNFTPCILCAAMIASWHSRLILILICTTCLGRKTDFEVANTLMCNNKQLDGHINTYNVDLPICKLDVRTRNKMCCILRELSSITFKYSSSESLFGSLISDPRTN